jgi:hypothetical protein
MASDSREDVKDEVSEELGSHILNISRGFEREHETIRDDHLLLKKKGEYFFRGYQRLYYDHLAHDYRAFHESPDYESDEDDQNRVYNVYRAHGEAVIAALTIEVPGVNFLPDDAKNANDIDTAKNYSAAALLIQRHNDVELLYSYAVYLAWVSPLVAAYHYLDEDKEYGTVATPKYKDQTEKHIEWKCQRCDASVSEDAEVCPECSSPNIKKVETEEKVSVFAGMEDTPKSRIKIKVYGVDHVKVSPYARTQKDTPYLILEFDEHITEARARTGRNIDGRTDASSYERYSRDPQGYESDDANRITTQCIWLRPCAYYYESVEIGNELKAQFPDGLYAEVVGDEVVEVRNEKLDDVWTIWESPVSSHLHMNPIGQPLFDPQEVQNDIVNLTVDTMGQAIPETFADPQVLDFDQYSKTRRKPGMVTQAKALAGRAMGEGFFTTRTATMSQEIDKFDSKNQQYMQLLVGAFPSIYGGTMQGGSKTYAEYSASRQQALQRLSLIHKASTRWYAKVMSKCVPIYVDSLLEDERYTAQIGPGEFLNLTIQADAQQGRIGHVEPSAGNQLPMSWGQQRDIIMELMKLNSDEINAVLYSPENSHMLQRLSGLPDLKIPGDESRTKQFREILQMITLGQDSDDMGPISATGEVVSPVQVDPIIDDHAVEAQICKSFLQSKEGQGLKLNQPKVYALILAHHNEHVQAMNSGATNPAMANAQSGQPSQGPPPNAPTPAEPNAPPPSGAPVNG